MTPKRLDRDRTRLAVSAALLLALTGCGPHMYDGVPALHDAKRSEVLGTWLGYDGTKVTFGPEGKAAVHLLDGQEWDFDDGWRLSGTGTWKLTDERTGWNDGQHVRLTLTSPTATATRAPAPDGSRPPESYTWTFELRREGEGKKALALYFFFGDPDSRSTYVLERA